MSTPKDFDPDHTAFDKIKAAAPAERLHAVMHDGRARGWLTERDVEMMLFAFKIVQENGWIQCAPVWLRTWRLHCDDKKLDRLTG